MKHKILNLILAIEIVLAADLWLIVHQHKTSIVLFYVCLAALWLLFCRIIRLPLKKHILLPILLPTLVALFLYIPWKTVSSGVHYTSPDTGKSNVFSGKKVMAIVPHEDDDINIAGGVLEQYVQYGSEVYVVFVTNGDYYGIGETRITEAINACEYMGIVEDHVIFLGYGDQWSEDSVHIYNAKSDQIVVSHAGNTQTYGTLSHPAYRTGRAYTINNLLDDLQSVILQYQPDTILCSDFDSHIDHKAVTLSFEKVMGRIRKIQPDYQPVVLKAYAYFPAWISNNDFYTLNILSTENIFESPYNQTPEVYEWENRIRLPVAAHTLSRSLVNSRAYAALQLYSSQEADKHAASIVNGDKVFWQRRTDSLLYCASVSATSGDEHLLNDFMLIDSNDILDKAHPPYDGTWIPSVDDHEKTVSISFDLPTDVHELILYDHPSPEDNVLNAVIAFDNGAIFETGKLVPGGSASVFPVNQSNVTSFTVTLAETEGSNAGLTEIEAYDTPYTSAFSMIKLTDQAGNFIYDYVIDQSGSEQFSLYTLSNTLSPFSADTYSVSCDNAKCSVKITNSMLEVFCPVGETCTITIANRETPDLSDSVVIRNPTALRRIALSIMQKTEQFFYSIYSSNLLSKTVFCRTPDAVTSGILQSLHDLRYFLYKIKVGVLEIITSA